MVKKIIQDIRKLVDKTPQVDVTIIDKSPIPASRGISELTNKKIKRSDIETTYTLIDIIDNVHGPVLHEDTNTEDVYDHLAKVTGMTDPDDSSLSIILKPNGIFD